MWGLIGALIPYFFVNYFFFIFKKVTSVASSVYENLQRLDQPTLGIFLTFFEKNYNDWIKCKLAKSQIKCTGL